MMAFDKEGSGVKMELVKSLEDFFVLHGREVTFYDSRKVPLWSGVISNCWGQLPTSYRYVSAERVQSFNKDGSKRKNSDGTGRKNKVDIFNIWYYSFGLTPEGVTPQPEADEAVLTQAQVDAKLKEYVTQRLENELTWKNEIPAHHWDKESLDNWNIPKIFVTIFKELTE